MRRAVDARRRRSPRRPRTSPRPARRRRSSRPADARPRTASAESHAGPRLAVVSAADPVDRATGRLVHLPDAPFLVGDLDPVDVLAALVAGPVLVDNDVNWAARAERDATAASSATTSSTSTSAKGSAAPSSATARSAAATLAWPARSPTSLTVGPDGRGDAVHRGVRRLGLRRRASTAIDVDALLAAVGRHDAPARDLDTLARAVGGVLAAVVALADPALVVLGGPWGSDPAVLAAVSAAFGALPRHVPVRAPASPASRP